MQLDERNPYKLLGVPANASYKDIRQAFRSKSKIYHPDRNAEASAETFFDLLRQAEALLSDEDKRRGFDMGQLKLDGSPTYIRNNKAEADLRKLQDLSSKPGFIHPGRGKDICIDLSLTFNQMLQGLDKKLHIMPLGALPITIPQGVMDGEVLKFEAMGMTGHKGAGPGDLYVTCHVDSSQIFQRDGLNMSMVLPVSLREAIEGGKIRLQAPYREINVSLPANTNSGENLVVRGEGIRSSGGRGDLYLEIRVMLPSKVDKQLKAFLRKWEKGDYDPRR